MPANPISHHDPSSWDRILIVSTSFLLMLVVLVGVMALSLGTTFLEGGYFFDHDAYLLIASGAAMLLVRRIPLHGKALRAVSQRQIAMIAAMGCCIAYACSNFIFHHYAVSRDEQSAEFAATYLSIGHPGWPIPTKLLDLALAMIPIHTTIRPDMWTSNYLPVNALIRAGTGLLTGDQWLASPILLMIGIVALGSSARRIWPDRPYGATVAVVMAVSSSQIVMTAATPFAMTGHFALNAVWIACFLRGGQLGHAGALGTGLLATGLHQTHFHITFVLCFVLWLATEHRWRLALLYASACVLYWMVWRSLYPAWMDIETGRAVAIQATAPYDASSIFSRLGQLQPGESLARFLAWQNLLLLPLAMTGAVDAFKTKERPRVLIACSIACASGLAMMIQQDHGFGYRYIHHLLPCFCLLAAGGWLAIEKKLGQRLPATVLTASVAFAALVTFPIASWRTLTAITPYRDAYRAARSAKADYLLVDPRAGAYLQDIVRFERDDQMPVILDLGYVPASALTRICRNSHVMVFGDRQARHFGIPVDPYRVANHVQVAERADQLIRLGCGKPMPTSDRNI